jgi:uncharacterized repeat protein (TIGR01451 family)
MKVINESRVDFQYRFSNKSPIITKTIFSNVVYTNIVKNPLRVKKYVDKTSASIYDILFYTIEISNIIDEGIDNVILIDFLPKGIKFINNSLKIDGVLYRCANISSGILLGTIAAKEKVEITFKAVVEDIFLLKDFVNYCAVSFNYIYNVEVPAVKVSINSNEVVTVCEDNLFKQFIVDNKVHIPKYKRTKHDIFGVKTEIKIIDTKIITRISNSEWCNILFLGVIKYRLYYVFRGKLYDYVSVKGFSTILSAPRGAAYFNKIDCEIIEEDTSYIISNKSNLYVSTSLLIKID